ncbi:molybdenum cofactor synthesis domain-containing protein [Peptoniphilus asaccharolyticus DSM 20463]|uniref:Molybdenum cofactor synthesis domain-containing protein n=1 Tax=Peptoniphilus asaccharolyticus DSM 20463 TaxID=573058 RepID=A0A1W1VAR2_PEPAS|nr:MogA/MoaB family molybdenum cofactor biosynthesis protein [Peptoniphilus asaccharolyticus]MBL7575703.1 MogA/MoaB family molybdenum cofactor biosynthesis protein [Peptoniphilus asaccharolyticus]SMB90448.1 molybdenum cofactor synthesis domain-containing protein [Peptoniphilus asaccharolyticus DSM 20463]
MYSVFILTVSDSGFYENKADFSGPSLVELMSEQGYEVVGTGIVPDDRELIKKELIKHADVNLILTTGGTGLGRRDITPEATKDVIDREVPGLAELMRMKSYEVVESGILSRQVCGTMGSCLIVNLPGSPKAAKENISFVLKPLEHALKMLNTEKANCAGIER